MSSPKTQPRIGLVPKTITDVNGNTKTVWVRPEEATQQDSTLAGLKPVIKTRVAEGLTHLRIGERQGSLRHTPEEKERASERGYGSDKLREAAARKFERDFGVSMKDAPPVALTNEQLYDYVARGVSVEHAYEFARFGVEPHLTHPKLDAEYAFIAGRKVAKADLRKQEASDSPIRSEELKDIRKTARVLQDLEVDPHVAAQCLANGLRMKHLRNGNHDLKETVEMSAKNNVESEKFQSFQEQPGSVGGLKREMRDIGFRMRRAMWRMTKRWAMRRYRRIYNGITRRISRMLRITFLPWKTH